MMIDDDPQARPGGRAGPMIGRGLRSCPWCNRPSPVILAALPRDPGRSSRCRARHHSSIIVNDVEVEVIDHRSSLGISREIEASAAMAAPGGSTRGARASRVRDTNSDQAIG